MSVLDLLAHRLRGSDRVHEDRAATRRSEQAVERVESQAEEAQAHARYARHVMRENELAAKIRRALREG